MRSRTPSRATFLSFPALALITMLAVAACSADEDSTLAQSDARRVLPTPSLSVTESGARVLRISLSEPTGEFQYGEAVFREQGSGTFVEVRVMPPEAVAQPIHVHRGSCEDVGPIIEPLEDVVDGRSATLLQDVTLDSLMDGSLLVNVHLSFSDISVFTACGEIPEMS